MSQVRLLCKLNDDSPQGWNVQIGRSFRGAETMASLLAPGTVAPDFTARDQDGNPVRLEDLRGRPVVLYFYPADDTPGCTREACAFRDRIEAFRSAGAPGLCRCLRG